MSSMCPDVFSLWHSAGPIYKWITTLLVGTIARLVQPMGLRQNASASADLWTWRTKCYISFAFLASDLHDWWLFACWPRVNCSGTGPCKKTYLNDWEGDKYYITGRLWSLAHCLDIMSIQKCCGNQTFHGPSCPKPTTSSTWQKTVAELPQFRNSRSEFFRCLCSC